LGLEAADDSPLMSSARYHSAAAEKPETPLDESVVASSAPLAAPHTASASAAVASSDGAPRAEAPASSEEDDGTDTDESSASSGSDSGSQGSPPQTSHREHLSPLPTNSYASLVYLETRTLTLCLLCDRSQTYGSENDGVLEHRGVLLPGNAPLAAFSRFHSLFSLQRSAPRPS
jgi:hypothetical protein